MMGAWEAADVLIDWLERELVAATAREAKLREALADLLAHPRWVSIGSIDNHVELPRIPREKYERYAALASSAEPATESRTMAEVLRERGMFEDSEPATEEKP